MHALMLAGTDAVTTLSRPSRVWTSYSPVFDGNPPPTHLDRLLLDKLPAFLFAHNLQVYSRTGGPETTNDRACLGSRNFTAQFHSGGNATRPTKVLGLANQTCSITITCTWFSERAHL